MGQRIVIDPVTRIEGHAKITIQLGDDGQTAMALQVAGISRTRGLCVEAAADGRRAAAGTVREPPHH